MTRPAPDIAPENFDEKWIHAAKKPDLVRMLRSVVFGTAWAVRAFDSVKSQSVSEAFTASWNNWSLDTRAELADTFVYIIRNYQTTTKNTDTEVAVEAKDIVKLISFLIQLSLIHI